MRRRLSMTLTRIYVPTERMTGKAQTEAQVLRPTIIGSLTQLAMLRQRREMVIDTSFSLRHFDQSLNVKNLQSFSFQFDDPLRFPLIEQAIHGKYGRAGELCQVALRYRDFDVTDRMFSNLVQHSNQLAAETHRNLGSTNLSKTHLKIVQGPHQNAGYVPSEDLEAIPDSLKLAGLPHQGSRLLDRRRC
jgi:hypothetical protein